MASNLGNRFAPPKSAVADIAGEDESQLASRWARLAAVIVDGLITSLAFTPAVASNFAQIAQQARGNRLGVWVALFHTGSWFYFGLLIAGIVLVINLILLARNGQTMGKKLLGIKIVRVDGSPATLFRVFFLRKVCNTLITLVPFLGSIYGLVDTLMIFGEKRRMAHDYLADTIVIEA